MRWPQLRAFVLLFLLAACSYSAETRQSRATDFELRELWQDPVDLPSRDLFYGPGGASLAPPSAGGRYQFVRYKTVGTNPGYDVRDEGGRSWSVKLGIEAQPEVTASRLLWAMGFYQPPQYFVREFSLTGPAAGLKRAARFRTEFDRWKSIDDWAWYDNAFSNTKAFRGLIVAQLLLNNWDLKTPNNRVYGAVDDSVSPRKLFVVRDVGSSFGGSRQNPLFKLLGTPGFQGSKNDLDAFEAQGFITGVQGNDVDFDYRGPNQGLVDLVHRPDVLWACELLSRLSDRQWQEAFRAGAYPEDTAARYIRKLKEKVAQGLALKTATR